MKKKKKKQSESITTKVPLPASFDKVNQTLKHRFSVKHTNYVTDNGIIQHGWLVTDERSFDEVIHLLKEQAAPMYILGPHGSAVIGWNSKRSAVIGSLWQDQKQKDTIRSVINDDDDADAIKEKLSEWFIIIQGR